MSEEKESHLPPGVYRQWKSADIKRKGWGRDLRL
jgi:hypothetical protein